jgi:phosphate transport system substrate-binding protein
MPSNRLLLAVTLLLLTAQIDARERIRIVGSSEVLTFVQPVAEQFALHWDQAMPALEVTGTGAGFELFCAGVGYEHPDAVAAARPMTEAERTACAEHGVREISAIEFGHDAMVLVHADHGSRIDLTRGQLFAALAAEVPSSDGLAPNRTKLWSDIDPTLPNSEILVMVPEPNTSAAIVFRERALPVGCRSFPLSEALGDAERARVCRTLRTDGRVVGAAKLGNQVLAWLEDNDYAYAVTDYTTYRHFAERTAVNAVEGVEPSAETIANGRYPLATGLYVYVKDRHVQPIPSLQQLLYELSSERALGPEGYLAESGLVPLDDRGRNRARDTALKFGM